MSKQTGWDTDECGPIKRFITKIYSDARLKFPTYPSNMDERKEEIEKMRNLKAMKGIISTYTVPLISSNPY